MTNGFDDILGFNPKQNEKILKFKLIKFKIKQSVK